MPWRVGAYVVGNLDAVQNALMLFDGYFQRQIKSATGEYQTSSKYACFFGVAKSKFKGIDAYVNHN